MTFEEMTLKVFKLIKERIPRMVKRFKMTIDPNIIIDYYLGENGRLMSVKELGKKYGKIIEQFRVL